MTEITLEDYGVWKKGQIDTKTGELILQGFSYDSETFSLSLEARSEWLALKTLEGALVWPITLPTLSGGTYNLVQANLDAFLGAGLLAYRGHKNSGRLLKEQVDACTTLDEAVAIEDTRS